VPKINSAKNNLN